MNNKTLESMLDFLIKEAMVDCNPEKKQIVNDLYKRIINGAFISYAQNYEDVVLNRIFKNQQQGFYVDVGAFDPVIKSVTCLFHKKGWKGINIDVCEENISKFNNLRPEDTNICVAVGANNGLADFYMQPGTTRTTKDKELAREYQKRGVAGEFVNKDVKTLTTILDEVKPKVIDFLTVDVEGAEKEIFEGMDFTKYRPKIILAEATYPETNKPNWNDWESHVCRFSYSFAYFDGLNRFYVADEIKDSVIDNFITPPNYFDNFIRRDQILSLLSI